MYDEKLGGWRMTEGKRRMLERIPVKTVSRPKTDIQNFDPL